jgi:hypothetical protein
MATAPADLLAQVQGYFEWRWPPHKFSAGYEVRKLYANYPQQWLVLYSIFQYANWVLENGVQLNEDDFKSAEIKTIQDVADMIASKPRGARSAKVLKLTRWHATGKKVIARDKAQGLLQ